MKKKLLLHGFTLIELIMVILLLSFIGTIATQLYLQGLRSALNAQNISDATWQGRLALERIIRDMRDIRSPTDISNMSSNQITYTDMSGTTITYQLSGTTLMRNSQILADGISSFSLNYYTKTGAITVSTATVNYVKINLTINQSNISYSLSTSLFLRDISS